MAFDVYLEILRRVNSRVQKALKRDTPNHNRLHVCPPCMYQIDNEPSLKYSLLVATDGNQSLKLVDSAFRAGDLRPNDQTLETDMWLTPEEVDVFKDEVKNAKTRAKSNQVCYQAGHD